MNVLDDVNATYSPEDRCFVGVASMIVSGSMASQFAHTVLSQPEGPQRAVGGSSAGI
jgi:hypothetical protein